MSEHYSSNIPNFREISEHVSASGQPSKSDLLALSKAGYRHIINLRSPTEISWNEEKVAHDYGMHYHALPIEGVNDISFQNAEKLDRILKQYEHDKTLLHCGSSNRVGALIALTAFKENGGDIEKAIEKGKTWGMTRLETPVRALLGNEIQKKSKN